MNVTALSAEMELSNDTMGPTFVQFYEVRNQGPSAVLGATLQIGLPVYTSDGGEIIQLLQQLDVTEGRADCHEAPLTRQVNTTSLRYVGEPATRALVINCTTGRIDVSQRVVIRLSARLTPLGIINVPTYCIHYWIAFVRLIMYQMYRYHTHISYDILCN